MLPHNHIKMVNEKANFGIKFGEEEIEKQWIGFRLDHFVGIVLLQNRWNFEEFIIENHIFNYKWLFKSLNKLLYCLIELLESGEEIIV